MTARRPTLALILAALLLLAQHAAVTHAIWHVHPGHVGHDPHSGHGDRHHPAGGHLVPDGHDEPSTQSQLCDFHFAFGEVLGAIAGHGPVFVAPRLDADARSSSAESCRHAVALRPQSRGPPALS